MDNNEEIAFAFDCQGDELIGFLHKGDQRCDIGVLTLVAGGPQYRGGVGRQLLNLGRRLASEGIPVMRFDSKGMGDSEGTLGRYSSMHNDIAAAIEEFKKQAPQIRGVILWGGCDAATTALINAYKFSDVVCVIAGNPFVSSPATANKATRRHYRSRLMQVSFWKKIIKMEYNIGEYAAAAMRKLLPKKREVSGNNAEKKSSDDNGNFLNEFLIGLRNFNGKVLFLMGDRFLTSDEFDDLLKSNSEWRAVAGKTNHERIDIKGGDQVFSSTEAQERMFDVASEWIHRAYAEHMVSNFSSSDRESVHSASGQTSV